MPIEARTKREKVGAVPLERSPAKPQRTESEQREMRLSPLAMLPLGERVKAPPSEAIQVARMEREGLDHSQDADGGHTEAEGV